MADEAELPSGVEPGPEPPGDAPAHWSFGTTADVGIGARAKDPPGLFDHLGQGLTELMTDRALVRPTEAREIVAESRSVEGLVVAFLTEVIVAQDTDGWLFSRFDVELEGRPPNRLRAKAWGERYDPARHPERVQVKAVTLHRLAVDLERGRARVIVDI